MSEMALNSPFQSEGYNSQSEENRRVSDAVLRSTHAAPLNGPRDKAASSEGYIPHSLLADFSRLSPPSGRSERCSLLEAFHRPRVCQIRGQLSLVQNEDSSEYRCGQRELPHLQSGAARTHKCDLPPDASTSLFVLLEEPMMPRTGIPGRRRLSK